MGEAEHHLLKDARHRVLGQFLALHLEPVGSALLPALCQTENIR